MAQRTHFHPLFHLFLTLPGTAVDLHDSNLPAVLEEDHETDTAIDALSAPPKFHERMTQISTMIGKTLVRGNNYTDLMMRCMHVIFERMDKVHSFASTLPHSKPSRVNNAIAPSFSFAFAPEEMQRLIEQDYETGDLTFSYYLKLVGNGVIAPFVTFPFHSLLPTIEDYDKRVIIRAGFNIYWPILTLHNNTIAKACGDKLFILPVQLPQLGYDIATLRIICQEAQLKANKEKTENVQLLLLLDYSQLHSTDLDQQMRSIGRIDLSELGIGNGNVWTIHTDIKFSSWTNRNMNMVKKVVDRTIAKVDVEWESKKLDYTWLHTDPLDEVLQTERGLDALEERFVKLHQLGHTPCAPDFYLRAKLSGQWKRLPGEPHSVKVKNRSACDEWNIERASFGRWLGLYNTETQFAFVDASRPYTRLIPKNIPVQEPGSQAWKIAWNLVLNRFVQHLRGNIATMQGGMLGALAQIVGEQHPIVTVKKNVQAFLAQYSMAYYRDIFVQQQWSEQECSLHVLCDELTQGLQREPLTGEEMAMAGMAAQGYYFLQHARRTQGLHWENPDQSAMFETVIFLMAAIRNTCYLYQWREEPELKKELFDMVRRELFEFHKVYTRYNLNHYGITPAEWEQVMKSQVDDLPDNIFTRTARFAAANMLVKLGFQVTENDPPVIKDRWVGSACGHIWNSDCVQTNLKWDNKYFCGVTEE